MLKMIQMLMICWVLMNSGDYQLLLETTVMTPLLEQIAGDVESFEMEMENAAFLLQETIAVVAVVEVEC